MKGRYELIVIGAGPAGGYAALKAASAGLSVLLVERGAQVGMPLACAEAASRTGLARFIDLHPSFIATEIYSLTFTVATGCFYTYRSDECLGFVLDRPTFDAFVVNRAVGAGAELKTATYADDIELSNSGPARVHLRTADTEGWVAADYVIAADGVESMIGRRAGLNTLLPLSRNDTSLQYRVAGIRVDPGCLEFCVGREYSPDGYLWVFAKSDHSANIGLGFNPAASDTRELRRILDRFLKKRYGDYTVEFESCGMVPKFVGLKNIGTENLLLAGDAARTVDSLTGAGITKALHTGGLAAQTIIEAASGRLRRDELVGRYREAIDAELGTELRFLEKAHRIFRKFNDRDWESLIRFLEDYLGNENAGSIDPASLIRMALTRAPRLIRLARHLL